jgi:periplasmic protein TonB
MLLLFLGLTMQIRFSSLYAVAALAGCASSVSHDSARDTTAAPIEHAAAHASAIERSDALTLDGYKRGLAQRIAEINADQVYPGRPQALLRSVIVVKYTIDAHGKLTHSAIVRSNRDHETEATALASLRKSAPFPKPASHLLHHGRIELSETWLFNNDGRFQLRTIAQPQMDS